MKPGTVLVVVSGVLILSLIVWSSGSGVDVPPLSKRSFSNPDLKMGMIAAPLREVMAQLPNRSKWVDFLARQQSGAAVHIDPRSGTPVSIIASIPLIPGTGLNNQVTLLELGNRLGRPLQQVTPADVADAVRQYVTDNQDILAIAIAQLGPVRAERTTDELWQISVPQQVNGVPVRHGRLVATVSSGNLVLIGTSVWGNAHVSTVPTVSADGALAIGFAYAGGRQAQDILSREPSLEVIPYDSPGWETTYDQTGAVGLGYGHRLAWVFVFVREPQVGLWEVVVDAHTGTLLAFEDITHYAQKISGGVYPYSNNEFVDCPGSRCGVMQGDYPMPFVDTNAPTSNQFANSAGVGPSSGQICTSLRSLYVKIVDLGCPMQGTFDPPFTLCNPGGTGDINLGGINGQHDCVGPEPTRNTAAARTAYYETNRIAEIARKWLPGNSWLNGLLGPIEVNVNSIRNCRSTGGGNQVFFGLSGPSPEVAQSCCTEMNCPQCDPAGCPQCVRECGNPGENASSIDHEWAHSLDERDSNQTVTFPQEAYPDIAAMYRLEASCFGYGVRTPVPGNDEGCPGFAADGGFNKDEDASVFG